MKLLYCVACGDLFNLQLTIKTCSCGKTAGRYERDGERAVVNGGGYSIAIGNSSFYAALYAAKDQADDPRQSQQDLRAGSTAFSAWARQHSGPSNPHTKVDKDVQ